MICMYLCTAECEAVMKKALVCVIVSLLLFFIGDKVFQSRINRSLIILMESQLSGEILPQRKLPRTITLRNISSEIGLIKYIFDVASFEEDLTNRV